MTVSLATLRTDAYTTMYNHLQTGAYAISTNNIHPDYNDRQFQEEGLPQVTIKVTTSKTKLSTGRVKHLYDCSVMYLIEIRHNSAANARTLADEVVNKITTGLSIFYNSGLKNIQWEEDDYDREYYGANKSQHIYKIQLSFRKMGVQ